MGSNISTSLAVCALVLAATALGGVVSVHNRLEAQLDQAINQAAEIERLAGKVGTDSAGSAVERPLVDPRAEIDL